LELSRNGFVVLCLDLPGHGGSDGSINQAQNDPTLGVDAAVNYLANLSYVDSTQIGLIGHSLGAGAVRAANTKLTNVQATVLIGGGVGNPASEAEFGSFNASYPKNVLIILGTYDVLFDIPALASKELLGLFNATQTVQQDVLYGDFNSKTARKLVTPQTIHLFESLDPLAINQTIVWMKETLKPNQAPKSQQALIYPYREISQAALLLSLLGLILLTYYPLAFLLKTKPKKTQILESPSKQKWKTYIVWFTLNLALFFPLVAAGLVIGFPPQVFGSSIAWWLLTLALTGFFILHKTSFNSNSTKVSIIQTIKQSLASKTDVLMGVLLFLILLAVVSTLQAFDISMKLVAPILQEFASLRRVLTFFAYLPFFLPYFIIQQLYLFSNNFSSEGKMEYAKIAFVNASPFLLLLGLNFLPKVLFNLWILPSFAGFLIEFLWLMTPIFTITTLCNLYFYRRTHSLTLGTIFNTLMLAWIAATVFPF